MVRGNVARICVDVRESARGHAAHVVNEVISSEEQVAGSLPCMRRRMAERRVGRPAHGWSSTAIGFTHRRGRTGV